MTSARYPVVGLRPYVLHPGSGNYLIGLFERELMESQEAAGMAVLGQFRDIDDPDRFVWLRGFPDMAARAGALRRFYGGPVWRAHRDEANATMIDSDNVLLMRPAEPRLGFPAPPASRPPVRPNTLPAPLIPPTLSSPAPPFHEAFSAIFASPAAPPRT